MVLLMAGSQVPPQQFPTRVSTLLCEISPKPYPMNVHICNLTEMEIADKMYTFCGECRKFYNQGMVEVILKGLQLHFTDEVIEFR